MAFSLIEVGKFRTQFSTLKSPSLANREMEAYLKEVQTHLEIHRPDVMIAERYMSRRMGGSTIEYVNMMLGALRVISVKTKTPLKMVPASQWKNELKRRGVDLKEFYKQLKKLEKRTPHEVDGCLIALFGAFQLQKRKGFDFQDIDKFMAALSKKLSLLGRTQ